MIFFVARLRSAAVRISIVIIIKTEGHLTIIRKEVVIRKKVVIENQVVIRKLSERLPGQPRYRCKASKKCLIKKLFDQNTF